MRECEPGLRGHFRGFPHRPFGRLAVAEDAVGPIVRSDPARVQRAADGGADALAERTGGHVHEREARGRVAFEVGPDVAHLQQFGAVIRSETEKWSKVVKAGNIKVGA